MHRQMLSDAIYEKVDALYEAHEDMHDAVTLLRVLARIAYGESIERAFGAPGDWGYGTAIGKALFHDPAPNAN